MRWASIAVLRFLSFLAITLTSSLDTILHLLYILYYSTLQATIVDNTGSDEAVQHAGLYSTQTSFCLFSVAEAVDMLYPPPVHTPRM